MAVRADFTVMTNIFSLNSANSVKHLEKNSNGILLRCAKGPREVHSTTRAAEKNATIIICNGNSAKCRRWQAVCVSVQNFCCKYLLGKLLGKLLGNCN